MSEKYENKFFEEKFSRMTDKTLDSVQFIVDSTGRNIEKVVIPIRKSILKRFPVLFLLAVTFGVTAVATGFEQILIQYDLLSRHPVFIIILGIVTLVLTGTLYRKLG